MITSVDVTLPKSGLASLNITTPFIKQNVKNGIITSFVLDHIRVDRFGEMCLAKYASGPGLALCNAVLIE